MKIINYIFLSLAILFFRCQENTDNFKYEKNYLKALELSAESEKPILIHFNGYGNVGYDEFKNDLITSREIQEKLNKKFVTVQLYVDDEKRIQYLDTLNLHRIEFTQQGKNRIKKAKTIGDINSVIELDLFKNNSQPLYVIIDSDENILVEPFGYTKRNRVFFMVRLDEGLNKYNKNPK